MEAIESFVSGKDTFVALPTGYGKSLIFAMLLLLFDFLHGKRLSNINYIFDYINIFTKQLYCCSCD